MIDELKSSIERYLEGGERRTLQGLASKANVSYSTLRRIAQGECKTVELATAVNLLQTTSTWAEMLEFLDQHFPEVAKPFRAVTAAMRENIDGELAKALTNFDKFVAVSMALASGGTTVKDVVAVIGERAASQIEELIGAGVLEVQRGRLFPVQKAFAAVDTDLAVTQISHCLRFLRPENDGKQKQIAMLHSTGVTREGQKIIHARLAAALAEVDEIAAAHRGTIPVFYSVTMGAFSAGEVQNA